MNLICMPLTDLFLQYCYLMTSIHVVCRWDCSEFGYIMCTYISTNVTIKHLNSIIYKIHRTVLKCGLEAHFFWYDNPIMFPDVCGRRLLKWVRPISPSVRPSFRLSKNTTLWVPLPPDILWWQLIEMLTVSSRHDAQRNDKSRFRFYYLPF